MTSTKLSFRIGFSIDKYGYIEVGEGVRVRAETFEKALMEVGLNAERTAEGVFVYIDGNKVAIRMDTHRVV